MSQKILYQKNEQIFLFDFALSNCQLNITHIIDDGPCQEVEYSFEKPVQKIKIISDKLVLTDEQNIYFYQIEKTTLKFLFQQNLEKSFALVKSSAIYLIDDDLLQILIHNEEKNIFLFYCIDFQNRSFKLVLKKHLEVEIEHFYLTFQLSFCFFKNITIFDNKKNNEKLILFEKYFPVYNCSNLVLFTVNTTFQPIFKYKCFVGNAFSFPAIISKNERKIVLLKSSEDEKKILIDIFDCKTEQTIHFEVSVSKSNCILSEFHQFCDKKYKIPLFLENKNGRLFFHFLNESFSLNNIFLGIEHLKNTNICLFGITNDQLIFVSNIDENDCLFSIKNSKIAFLSEKNIFKEINKISLNIGNLSIKESSFFNFVRMRFQSTKELMSFGKLDLSSFNNPVFLNLLTFQDLKIYWKISQSTIIFESRMFDFLYVLKFESKAEKVCIRTNIFPKEQLLKINFKFFKNLQPHFQPRKITKIGSFLILIGFQVIVIFSIEKQVVASIFNCTFQIKTIIFLNQDSIILIETFYQNFFMKINNNGEFTYKMTNQMSFKNHFQIDNIISNEFVNFFIDSFSQLFVLKINKNENTYENLIFEKISLNQSQSDWKMIFLEGFLIR